MIETSGYKQSGAFSWWLRTGKLPPSLNPDGLELKFNAWHDRRMAGSPSPALGAVTARAGQMWLAGKAVGRRPVLARLP